MLFHAHTSSGLSLIAYVEGTVGFLFREGACSDFCSLGWAVMACQLLLAVWLVPAMYTYVDRANRVCLACKSGAIGDEKHMIFECTALAPLRQQHADLFTPRTDTMRSFFAQQNHLGVICYRLSRFHEHVTLYIAVIGASDQSCWKILLLLLLLLLLLPHLSQITPCN